MSLDSFPTDPQQEEEKQKDLAVFNAFQETAPTGEETTYTPVDRETEATRESAEQRSYRLVSEQISEAGNIESLLDALLNAPLPLKDEKGKEFNITRAAQVLNEIKHDLAFRKFNNDESMKVPARFIDVIPPGLGLKEKVAELYQ